MACTWNTVRSTNTRGFVGNEGETLRLGCQAGHFFLNSELLTGTSCSLGCSNPQSLPSRNAHFPPPHPLAQRWSGVAQPTSASVPQGDQASSWTLPQDTRACPTWLSKTSPGRGGPCRRCHPQEKEVRIGKGTQDGACLCAGFLGHDGLGVCLRRGRGNVGTQSQSIPHLGSE